MVITLDFESSNPGSNPGRTFFLFFCLPCIFQTNCWTHSKLKFPESNHDQVQWPSGLRRSTQVRVSSEAWVRIPSEPFLNYLFINFSFHRLNVGKINLLIFFFGVNNHTFSAFWLRSSVVSVLISLISGTRTKCSPDD